MNPKEYIKEIVHEFVAVLVILILTATILNYVMFRNNGGWYNPLFRTYTLRADRTFDDIERTNAHEFGHDIWFWRLNNTQREEYELIYKLHLNNSHKNCNPQEDLIEDFAESWEYYHYHDWDFWPCSEKRYFFNKIHTQLKKEGSI